MQLLMKNYKWYIHVCIYNWRIHNMQPRVWTACWCRFQVILKAWEKATWLLGSWRCFTSHPKVFFSRVFLYASLIRSFWSSCHLGGHKSLWISFVSKHYSLLLCPESGGQRLHYYWFWDEVGLWCFVCLSCIKKNIYILQSLLCMW